VASLGIESVVTVVRRLRVAYFSTGDEILSLGEAPARGAVYDSNRYTVHGLLTRLGCEVIDMGVVRDDPALLETAFPRPPPHRPTPSSPAAASAWARPTTPRP
jgi:molybdopterin molybdotransferase